jgi:hypothetical protein
VIPHVLDRATLLRRVWAQLTSPGMDRRERLFFELYGMALQGRPGTEGFLDRAVDGWIDDAVSAARHLDGSPPADSELRAAARLDLAVVRGLLADALATGDVPGTTAALERYLAPGAAPGTTASVSRSTAAVTSITASTKASSSSSVTASESDTKPRRAIE